MFFPLQIKRQVGKFSYRTWLAYDDVLQREMGEAKCTLSSDTESIRENFFLPFLIESFKNIYPSRKFGKDRKA